MKKLYYLSAALTLLLSQAAVAQSGPTKSETKVEAQPGKLVIPYEKFTLANGLTVIINEDHSDPIVHVEVTYHVGSNRETPKRTGFAHFFEHMMFQGSQNVADEEHFKIVQGSGGDMNGTTNRDRTNYFETVPSNMLETALWLEADRMGFLLPAFTNKKFETQRATVKNEKDQRYADGYGMLPEIQDQTIYPYGHPYSWQTIGYVDDLNAADSSDLRNFFLKWYGPNNAILVISGDVNTQEALKLVEKYFGSINRGPEIPPLAKNPVVILENKIVEVKSEIFAPLTSLTLPTVPTFHKDEAALDILASLISNGKNSVLYKNFIDDETCLQAFCSNSTYEISGEFNFIVVTYPESIGGLTEKEIRDRIMKSLVDFETKGFTDEDLRRIKSEFTSRYYGILETVASKASVLTQYEMLTKGKMSLDKDIDRYSKVTKEDIMRVFNTYIKGKNYACIHIKPEVRQEGENAKKLSYESVNPYAKENPDKSAYANLTYKPTVDPANFDRSKKPVVGPAKPAPVPTYYKSTFENGIKVIGTQSKETPRVYISINMRGGHLFETGKIKNGTSAFLGAMMSEGTKTKTALQIENMMSDLGSEISFGGSEQSFSCFIECYKDSLKQTMALFEDMFFNTVFVDKEFKLNKKAILGTIKNNNFQKTSFGNQNFIKFIYGSENPIGSASLTDYSAANKITKEDLENFKNNFLSPNLTTISVVGDVSEQSILENMSFLKNWQNKNIAVPAITNFPPIAKTQIYMVNQDGAKQTSIMMGYRTIPADIDGDFFKANVMNFALGGAFNSRLNLNLREDKGWTYGIRSGFSSRGQNIPGMFIISAGVKKEATDSAIREIFKEVKNYIDNGITDEELAFTKRSLLGEESLGYESPFGKLGFLTQILTYNLEGNFTAKRAEIINNLTKEDINAIAKKYLSLDNLVIICVGDDVFIMDKLEALGLGKVKVLKAP
ncbi:MAG TPA: pitrilysin family protein, partial [Bacteroidia bacterium]